MHCFPFSYTECGLGCIAEILCKPSSLEPGQTLHVGLSYTARRPSQIGDGVWVHGWGPPLPVVQHQDELAGDEGQLVVLGRLEVVERPHLPGLPRGGAVGGAGEGGVGRQGPGVSLLLLQRELDRWKGERKR